MIYIRNLFNQDLRDGKQIAFPTEPSNIFFKFSFSNQDADRQISFRFKEKNANSTFYTHNDTIINTRLYAAGSEARIDGQLKEFLRDTLSAKIDDIVVFKTTSTALYDFEFIPQGSLLYSNYKTILNNKNHEVVLEQVNNETNLVDIDNINPLVYKLVHSKKIRDFVFDVFKFLVKEFGTDFIQNQSAIAKRELGPYSYNAYLFPEYFQTKPILGSFDLAQSEETLKTSNTLRFFSENLEILNQKHIYFSTQWGFPELENSKSFKDFNSFVKDFSKSKYKIIFDTSDEFYKLVLNSQEVVIPQVTFNYQNFATNTQSAGLIFSPQLIQRFIASLCTKPFVICSGLSGSGKTKLSQAFAQWISADKSQYEIVPVGADWTNREPLLGYPNALSKEEYVMPENGVLALMIRARDNESKPYFLILDEMNLSHVERYFADFLSTMESGDKIPLHKMVEEINGIPEKLKLPKNLFIIGTVNIDETTYMFSPKVLDRANTIEFRLSEEDLQKYIASDISLNMDLLTSQGASMSDSFLQMALQSTSKNLKPSEVALTEFFTELKKAGAEFGFRTASEIGRLMFMLEQLGEKDDNLLDIAIMQKLLPKLHGSRNKLTKVLPILGGFCLIDNSKVKEDYLDKFLSNTVSETDLKADKNIKYHISFEKICRMYKNAIENGFASYAEA
jgi:hypothetical protein